MGSEVVTRDRVELRVAELELEVRDLGRLCGRRKVRRCVAATAEVRQRTRDLVGVVDELGRRFARQGRDDAAERIEPTVQARTAANDQRRNGASGVALGL